MRKQIKAKTEKNNKIILFISIFIFSFLLNFVWESLHGSTLYKDHNMLAIDYVKMVSYVSFMDGLLIILIYLIISICLKNINWIKKNNMFNYASFFLIGLIIAVIIEILNVYIYNRWSYNSNMITLFGIGISPLFQLAITGIISLLLIRSKKLY